jgi:hypothetical protein
MRSEQEIERMKTELQMEMWGIETAIDEICEKKQIDDYEYKDSERWNILKVRITVLDYVLDENKNL